MAHGSGGVQSAALMKDVFEKHFGNDVLARLEDSAVVDIGGGAFCSAKIAVSTDSFVVSPLVFPGGDIGRLAVCGTVNDVLMSGAEPRYITCGFVIEAGLSIDLLDGICVSLAKEAEEAGVTIIAGDTKVIEGHGADGGLIINTTGIGVFSGEAAQALPKPSGILPGDAIIVSGHLGDHHAAILSARMGIQNSIQSDCALLTPILKAIGGAGIAIHAMRDVTRGGLATILNELAIASGVPIVIEEESIPADPVVRALCGVIGLDPLYMGNEGKLVLAVSADDAAHALAAIKSVATGKNAELIGFAGAGARAPEVSDGKQDTSLLVPVSMRTRVGGTVRIDGLYGEGLPRIC